LIGLDCIYDQTAVIGNRHWVDCFWWGDFRLNNNDKSAGLFKATKDDIWGPSAFNDETAKRWADVVKKHDHVFAMLDCELFPGWTLDDVRRALDVLQPLLPDVRIVPTLSIGTDTHRKWFSAEHERHALEQNRDLVERVGLAWFGAYLDQKANQLPDNDYGRDYSIDAIATSARMAREVYGPTTPLLAWCSTDYNFPEWTVREGVPMSGWNDLPREPVTSDDVAALLAALSPSRVDYLALWGRRENVGPYKQQIGAR
jgi:hypothetical protein